MWARRVVSSCQPRARVSSAQGHPWTGQNTRRRAGASAVASMSMLCPSWSGGRRRGRSLPTGVPGAGTMPPPERVTPNQGKRTRVAPCCSVVEEPGEGCLPGRGQGRGAPHRGRRKEKRTRKGLSPLSLSLEPSLLLLRLRSQISGFFPNADNLSF